MDWRTAGKLGMKDSRKTGNGGQKENLEWRTARKLRMEDSRKFGN